MKIFSRSARTSLVNFEGEIVQFVNGIAEVSDELGQKILNGGYSGVYEYGKQPVFQTPKEVQMKSDFKEKEDWYQKELARVTNIADARKVKIAELEVEVKTWKEEYEKEHQARLALAEAMGKEPEPKVEEPKENPVEDTKEGEGEGKTEDEKVEEIREELFKLKKDELISFGEEMKLDMTEIKEKTKAEIIEYIVANYSE